MDLVSLIKISTRLRVNVYFLSLIAFARQYECLHVYMYRDWEEIKFNFEQPKETR